MEKRIAWKEMNHFPTVTHRNDRCWPGTISRGSEPFTDRIEQRKSNLSEPADLTEMSSAPHNGYARKNSRKHEA